MHYKISVQIKPDLTVYMGYTCRFDDREWAPYQVVEVDGNSADEALRPGDLLKAGIQLNEPIAYIKQVYVDPRTQYRVTRNLDGTAQYVMLRRLAEDGSTNTGTVMTPDGQPTVSKVFVRGV
jgi:hypothetical protein